MSAILPRSQKKSQPPKLAHSSAESKKGKKSFYGTGEVQRKSSRDQEQVAQYTSHPWSGFIDGLLRPLPPDVRYNIQRALGGFAEAVGRMFPQQGQGGVQVGRRGF